METPVPKPELPEQSKEVPADAETLALRLMVNQGVNLIKTSLPHDFDLPEQLEINLKSDMNKWGIKLIDLMKLLDKDNECTCSISKTSKEFSDNFKNGLLAYMSQFQILILSHGLKQQEQAEIRNKRAREFANAWQREHAQRKKRRII